MQGSSKRSLLPIRRGLGGFERRDDVTGEKTCVICRLRKENAGDKKENWGKTEEFIIGHRLMTWTPKQVWGGVTFRK